MGDCSTAQGKWNFNNWLCGGSMDQNLCSVINSDAAHEGIKTVHLEKLCEFSSTNSALCVNIVTWNMNGKEVSAEALSKLVGSDRKFDLFVVGLQEVPRCSMTRVLQEALLGTHSLLGKAKMQSLHIYIFGLNSLELHVKEMRVDKHSIGGCGGLIGRKKGAVSISINVNNIRLAFISCHLAAHAGRVEKRNSQCRHISHSLYLKDQKSTYLRPYDVTVWLGDLNYRLEGVETMPARSLIHNNLHNQQLTSKDQLLQEAERGQVFGGYCEGTLSFKPTYKYNIGTSNYDTSYKVRVPAWTDRILFKTGGHEIDAALHAYESIDGIDSSDHKPVKAHLCLKINKG